MTSLLPLLGLLLFAACAPHYQHVAVRDLAAGDTLVCPGYLVWNRQPVRDVFLVMNGSGTLSNAFVNPTFDSVMRNGQVGYATFDKPGIRAPFGDPAALRRDDATLRRYTLGHGIACATEALRWARAQFPPTARLHLRGHSEGTLIALYVYDALLQDDPELAAQITTVVLSGLALEPFADILKRQLATIPDGDRVRQALASCDWPVLEKRMGVLCAYVADASRRPSGRAMLERLAARGTKVRFHVFQGTDDWNTPVAPVRAFQAWNASVGHLDMTFHYYQGGHAGSEAARSEMARVLAAIIDP